ncbi:MAG: tRNA pseudouridine(13) synthase TruD [Polyangiaceae bacterium]|nr:tRNA pseudouridine(13) synthase TruD [Polyangiaceae bacterium]
MRASLPTGRIKSSPDDFLVDEIAAYEPCGTGEHLYVHFRKRGLTTDEAARAIANALGADFRQAGIAGLKDKAAVTTQWMSVLVRDPNAEARAMELSLPNIEILAAKRHGNKLKTGHLRGNRFRIVVRGLADGALGNVKETFARIANEGVPNAFGLQRFGREGDTASIARAWLTGKARAPSNPRVRRFHFSALQSAIFNAVLEARVADGSWNVPAAGDILKKEDTGGLFLCTDASVDRERALRGELCPTGPIIGEKMQKPEGEIRALEERVSAPFLEGIDLHRARTLGEGTRRALRLRVIDPSIDELTNDKVEAPREHGGACEVCFVLPKGAYATTVLGNVFDLGATPSHSEPS